jgi:hypothetical protein
MRLDRKLVTNLVLVGLALATTAVVYLTRDRPTQEEREARPRNLIQSFPRDELTSVRVQGGGQTLVLRAEPAPDGGTARYWVVARGEVEADAEAARSFLRALELAAFSRELDGGNADRQGFGLTTPRLELGIEFRHSRGKIAFGKQAVSPSDSSYVEVTGFGAETPRIGLIKTAALAELSVTEESLRPRWLVNTTPSDLVRFSIQRGSNPVQKFERSGPAFRRDGGERVSRTATDQLLIELGSAKATSTLEGGSEAFGADVIAMVLEPVDNRPPSRIELGGPCPGKPELLAFRRSSPHPGSYCVSAGIRRLFDGFEAALGDDLAFALRADEVETLTIERGEQKLVLTRSAQGFELAGKPPSQVELDAGNGVLSGLVSVRGEPVNAPDLAALGLEPPAATIRLVSSAVEHVPHYEERVDLGKPRPNRDLPLRRRDDGRVLLVPADAAAALIPDPERFRARRLLELTPSDFKTLVITRGAVRERLRRTEAGTFELVEPSGHEHDAGAVLEVVQALGTLEVDRWAAAQAEPAHGLDHPTVTVEIGTEKSGKPQTLRLVVGGETRGGFFATLSGYDGVFVLSKPLVYELSTSLLSRSVFVVDPSSYRGIVFRAGARSLELERRADGFVAKGATDELAPALIERLVATASALRAEAALHAGAARAGEGFEQPSLEIRFVAETPAQSRTVSIGAETSLRGESVRFARIDNVNATYAIGAAQIRELREAL